MMMVPFELQNCHNKAQLQYVQVLKWSSRHYSTQANSKQKEGKKSPPAFSFADTVNYRGKTGRLPGMIFYGRGTVLTISKSKRFTYYFIT